MARDDARPQIAGLASSFFGLNAPKAPPRIEAAIASHEAASEVIVGWVQISGVALFFVLYAASYGAFAVHSHFEPAPIALALYGGFTAWRLARAHSGKLGKIEQYLSIVVDIGLLIGLIWSFPFQYDAPFALYLKAPTLLYVFLLIALRALRFDAAQVLFAGVLAALGWVFLVWNAWVHGTEVTSSYPHYMTSHAILFGAELEKIAAILGFSAILALSVARARALLVQNAVEETAARDLSQFVGDDAALRIRSSTDGVKSGDGERRYAAIMFIDLRGFTPASKGLAPEAVISLLKSYQERVVPVALDGGGSVDKFLGDGVLVSFGAAVASGTECADALAAAFKTIEAADRWRAERRAAGEIDIDLSVAIASGEVIYGAVGAAGRLEYTVIGDAVNLAAKLEKHAKVEHARIISTGDAVDRALAQGYRAAVLRRIPKADVEGAGEPIEIAILA